MRSLVATFGVLIVAPAAAAAGQVHVDLEVGAMTSSHLVRDSIVGPLSVAPDPALSAGVRVTTALHGLWRMGVLGRMARGNLALREAAVDTPLTRLTVWHVGAVLERRLIGRTTADANVGVLLYRPARRRATFFQDGAPRPIVWGIGLRYEHPVSTRVRAGLRVAYDGHRFGTETLRANGFTDKRFVHRFFFGITLGWHGAAPAQL